MADDTTRELRARGMSMLPGIYPRDRLFVRRVRPADLAPGAVVAYPGQHGSVVMHRVLAVEPRGSEQWLVLRGDAQWRTERVRADAAFWILVEVDGRLGRWSAEGRRGRALTALALARDPVRVAIRRAAVAALRGAARLRR